MDTNSQAASLLSQWWEEKQFEGKEYCKIDEEGNLLLRYFSDKIIAKLQPETGDVLITQLLSKYENLEKEVEDFNTEWQASEDRLKLNSKINRLVEYIEHAPAIGDFEKILNPLHVYKNEIKTLLEKNYQAKEALVTEAEGLKIENNNWKEVQERIKAIVEEWRLLGFVEKNKNEKLWERLEKVKQQFFEEKREHQDDIEKEMLINLDFKMELVEKAEAISQSEDWRGTSEEFKQLFEDWKKLGRTVADKNEELWQKFIAAKNNFFDRKNAHTDKIKVEQEANYELKKIIVTKAEALQHNTDWAITTKAYADLMEEWKAIGPTPSEYGNSLWEGFSAAKDIFFGAKKSQADEFRASLQENYDKKMVLIERAESIKNSSNWRDTTAEMNHLFDDWKQVGFVGKEHNEPLWQRFLSARKHFFNRKDEEFKRKKEQYEKNKELHFLKTKDFLKTLELESEDESAQIIEFTENLKNISEGPKSEELKTHLSKLIKEIEKRFEKRTIKIEDVKKEIEKLSEELNPTLPENKSNEINGNSE